MKEALILYTRDGCHLCSEAAGLARGAGVPVEEVDIYADNDLLEKYCISIPVLKNPATGAEIGWPFGVEEISHLYRAGSGKQTNPRGAG